MKVDENLIENPARIVMLNDDETPFSFVIKFLRLVFNKSETEAAFLANEVNKVGSGICGVYPEPVASSMLEYARGYIEQSGYKLQLVLESASGASEDVSKKCSFCGKPSEQVKILFAGQSGNICNECIVSGASHLNSKLPAQQFKYAYEMLDWHFSGISKEEIVTSSRKFPARVRVDLQLALEEVMKDGRIKMVGVHVEHHYDIVSFSSLLQRGKHPTAISPLQYQDIDVGGGCPVPCLQNALWLLAEPDFPYAVLLSHNTDYTGRSHVVIEVAVPSGEAGGEYVQKFFARLEKAVSNAKSYRGKVLSLEFANQYSGMSNGITVHKLSPISRDQIILPQAVLGLLDRNVIDFNEKRKALQSLGQSTKKGLLFYGPPGTGKTHTVRYLAGCLGGHTTLLITAEQVGILGEYFELARLLQPSILVIEDVDLIARDRESMQSACEEVLLNKLLNEMDGLREDSEIFFILTTNRPEMLEAALASRPGRIDQAIEFPLPDEECRRRLIALYSKGMKLSDTVMGEIARRTEGVSAAFIKELMRRVAQYCIEENGEDIKMEYVNESLEEMLFKGGQLNKKLLGAS